MMTKEEIGRIINPRYPGVYSKTIEATKLIFNDGKEIVGYFDFSEESTELEKKNIYTFVEFKNSQKYKTTRDQKFITKVDGNKLKSVEHPYDPSNIHKSKKQVYWFEVYDKLAKGLCEFHNSCEAKNIDSGEELYRKCIARKEFTIYHKWIEKFKEEFGIESLDPIHVFASINANKLSHRNRIKRISIFFKILKDASFDFEIDFMGCPAPAVIKLLGARKKEHQQQIWNLFVRIQEKQRRGLNSSDFSDYTNWYGIEFSSFTTFLFWISSDKFLPIETNVRTFLVASKIADSSPKNYNSYLDLLKHLDKYNYSSNEKYGRDGVFREIAHIAYQTIGEGIKEIQYSQSLRSLLNVIDPFLASGSFKMTTKIAKTKRKPKVKKIDKQPIQSLEDKTISLSEISKLGFKLIAIKPLANCDASMLNVLEKKKYYYFESSIEINSDSITYFPERNINLYSLKKPEDKNIYLNFTAIVGKNGSGKSTLIELLFRIINNISFSKRSSLKTRGLRLIKGLFAEFFYVHSGFLYRFVIKEEKIQIQEFELIKNNFVQTFPLRSLKKEDLQCFFYTISVNYSHYALNSLDTGPWINGLFHKTDGYQTPIVLNPMRTNGDIDINVENELVKSRLIANLLSPVASKDDIGLRQITEKQKAVKIDFKLIPNKNRVLFETKNGTKILYSQLKGNKNSIFKLIKEIFEFPIDFIEDKCITVTETKKYIIRKLVRISCKYFLYKEYFDQKTIKFGNNTSLIKYLKDLKDDDSHITYKLKQAINYWKFQVWSRDTSFILDIFKDGLKFENFISSNGSTELIEFIPPPIFSSEIVLFNTDDKRESSFSKLSSGEKQLIHSASSILYHIKNIDSIRNKRNLISYNVVNVVLDEIELYYHPELQRKYINYLISLINKMELNKVDAINFCLVTHSPFILSDIPRANVLFLDKSTEVKPETFAANIHELLASNFFLKEGLIGDFAKGIIQNIINKLHQEEEKKIPLTTLEINEVWHIIKIIGEPFLERKLREMFIDRYGKKESPEEEVIRLQRRLKELTE